MKHIAISTTDARKSRTSGWRIERYLNIGMSKEGLSAPYFELGQLWYESDDQRLEFG